MSHPTIDVETRKIQSVGGGTYTVSLPKEWAQSHDLETGDTVNLHTHIDGVVTIQVQDDSEGLPDEVTVLVTDRKPKPLERAIRAAYAVGANAVILEAEDAFSTEQRRAVEQVTRTLTGVSVTEETKRRLRIQTLLDSDEVSVYQSVRQLKFIALSMHQDATESLTGDATAGDLTRRDDQADRLYAMLDRSLALGLTRLDSLDALGVTRPELFELWVTTRELERVADHAVGIATATSQLDTPTDEGVLEGIADSATRARTIVADAVGIVVDDSDINSAPAVLDACDQLRNDFEDLSRQLGDAGETATQLRPVFERVRRTAEHGRNIAEIGLQRSIRQDERRVSTDTSLQETAVSNPDSER